MNICFTCNKEYKPTNRNQKNCSLACYAIYRKGRARKEARYSYGYRYLFLPNHPDSSKQGYIAEHRLIGEKKMGRRLLKTEVVHHLNGVRDDNRLENIVVCSRAEHNLIDEEIIAGKKKRIEESKKGVIQMTANGVKVKFWGSRTEAALHFGCSISSICYAVKTGSLSQGFRWVNAN